MLSKVKLFWPLGAFVFAAVLVAVFVSDRADRKSEISAEEVRQIRYENALRSARYLFNSLEYLKAVEGFEKLGRQYSDLLEPEVHLEIARAIYCYRLADTVAINLHIEKFLEHYKGTSKERQADAIRGEMLNRAGKYKEALDLLERVTEQEVDRIEEHVHVYMELGRAYYHLGDYARAKIWLEDVVKFPRNARDFAQANFLLGEICARTAADKPQCLRDALEYFEREKSDDQYPGLQYAARVRMADMMLRLGEYRQAQEMYLWALDALPQSKEGMVEFLPESKGIGQEELKLEQVVGAQATKAGGPTKLERIVAHYFAASKEKTAGDLLVVIAGEVEDGSAYFLRAATIYRVRADKLQADIEKLQADIALHTNRLNEQITEDALAHMREEIAAKDKERRILLTLAARNYISAFDAQPYGKYGEIDVLDHPLWHAAMILRERKAYASAKDVLYRVIDDALSVPAHPDSQRLHGLGRYLPQGRRLRAGAEDVRPNNRLPSPQPRRHAGARTIFARRRCFGAR